MSLNIELAATTLSSLVLFVILLISYAVNTYALYYMAYDAMVYRFMGLLCAFTTCMALLAISSNVITLFIYCLGGASLIGLFSYLLIGYWSDRILATISSLKALFINKVGDVTLTIGIVILLSQLSTTELSLVNTVIPSCTLQSIQASFAGDNGSVIGLEAYSPSFSISTLFIVLILIAAAAKSAQILLHTWLSDAILNIYVKLAHIVSNPFSLVGYLSILVNKLHNRYASLSYLYSFSMVFIAIVFVSFVNPFVFFTLINPIGNMNLVQSVVYLMALPPLVATIPKDKLARITACMLTDGYIRPGSTTKDGVLVGNARYSMTMGIVSMAYLETLKKEVFQMFIDGTDAKGVLIPYPNPESPEHKGEEPKQYTLNTGSVPTMTELFMLWYVWDPTLGKFVKIVPLCIMEMLGIPGLGDLVIQDGYFEFSGRNRITIFCTECFTKLECLLLIQAFKSLGIVVTLKRRDVENDRYRLRVATRSMPTLIKLALPNMPAQYHYKLGVPIYYNADGTRTGV